MISNFEEFALPLSEVAPLSELNGAVIAIEAGLYLSRLLVHPDSREPLLAALGGIPFTMRRTVTNDVNKLREAGITPFFVFDGMAGAKTREPFRRADEAARNTGQAWSLYSQHHADSAVAAFGESGLII
jgi:hypothetical protein